MNFSAKTPYYKIIGGSPLQGEVEISGAKNAATKMMVASLLSKNQVTLTHVPRIGDTEVTEKLLLDVGTKVEWFGPNSVRLCTESILNNSINQAYSGINRIPILLIGPLLARCGEAHIPLMGGCKIGSRPVNFHLMGLRAMGVEIDERDDGFYAKCSRLQGSKVHLPYPSVGATENLIIAGCLAEGITEIKNAAVEPEVLDLVMMLQKMGANILVDVDRTIIIEGENELHGTEHEVIPDRIEAASMAVAGLMTKGKVELLNIRQEHMTSFFNLLKKIKAPFEIKSNRASFGGEWSKINPVAFETDVHPGIMTDWQQPFVILLTQANGLSVVHETVYERRLGYTKALNKMGAEIQLFNECLGSKPCRFKNSGFPHSCVIKGPTPLQSANITIPDLRAGFSYLVAALAAEGESIVDGVAYIERGYENILGKLQSLGAKIERIS